MRKFEKAPEYKGKYLDLHIGSGSRRIKDNEVLTGDKWARFVAHGFLVEIKEPPSVLKGLEEPSIKVKNSLEMDMVFKSKPEPEAKLEVDVEPEKEEEPVVPVKKKRGRKKKSSK